MEMSCHDPLHQLRKHAKVRHASQVGQQKQCENNPAYENHIVSSYTFTRKRKRQHPVAQNEALADYTNTESRLNMCNESTRTLLRPQNPCYSSGAKRPVCRQTFIDLGQKDFGPSQCKECGMMYSRGVPEDEKAHSRFHKLTVHQTELGKLPLKAFGKRIATGVQQVQEGKLLTVTNSDSLQARQRAVQVCARLEHAFGCADKTLCTYEPPFLSPRKQNARMLLVLLVTNDKQIRGAIVAERIHVAYSLHDHTDTRNAVVGVYALFVEKPFRSRGIATALCAQACVHTVPGYVAKYSELAFSQPTADGTAFLQSLLSTSGSSTPPLVLP